MRRASLTSNNKYFLQGVLGIREQISERRKLGGQNSTQPQSHAHPTLSQPAKRGKGLGPEKRLTGSQCPSQRR